MIQAGGEIQARDVIQAGDVTQAGDHLTVHPAVPQNEPQSLAVISWVFEWMTQG